ncbi:MAG TPA: hypothetical protein VMS00_06985 [Acidimicrobiales bacterium]|nr:hypothetical protein [Acidimicrobiales bacterium]
MRHYGSLRSISRAVCAVLVAAGLVGGGLATGLAGGGVSSASAPPPAPAPSPDPAPAPAVAAAVAVSGARFDPLSVTFVSLKTGWVLGTSPCSSGTCLGLRETTDAGRSWAARPLPAALVAAADRKVSGSLALDECCGGGLNVRFANLLDGWIFGGLLVPAQFQGTSEPALWSTHNGGATWVQDRLPAGLSTTGSIFDLEAAGGKVYLMARDKSFGITVESSPLGQDSWRHANTVALGSPAGGGEQSGAFVLQGAHGWLAEGNDRGTTGSAELVGGRWVGWVAPCASVGDSFAIPAASTPEDLVAVCVMGGFAEGLSKSAPKGATLGSSWLYFSTNGGSSFQAGPELGPLGDFFSSFPACSLRRSRGSSCSPTATGARNSLRASTAAIPGPSSTTVSSSTSASQARYRVWGSCSQQRRPRR